MPRKLQLRSDKSKDKSTQIFIKKRISYPNARILLGLADIKASFKFARIHADLTGAFGFIVDNLFNFATAMVFGLTASASSWEAFC